MNDLLKREVERLIAVFEKHGKPVAQAPMQSADQIDEAQRRTGIVFSEGLRAFHMAFGGRDYTDLFAVTVAGPMMLAFRSLPGALDAWDPRGPHPAPNDNDLELPARDARIQPAVILHPGWLPLAEFNGGSTLLYFDDAPAPGGRRGQIIVYQHDPDEVFHVAEDFVGLLRSSNDLLEQQWDELFPTY